MNPAIEQLNLIEDLLVTAKAVRDRHEQDELLGQISLEIATLRTMLEGEQND